MQQISFEKLLWKYHPPNGIFLRSKYADYTNNRISVINNTSLRECVYNNDIDRLRPVDDTIWK